MSRELYIAGGSNLYFYDGELRPILEQRGEAMMGLAWHGDTLFAGAKSKIYTVRDKQEVACTQYNRRPDFHKCEIYGDRLYMTCTAINQIWELGLDLTLLARHKIAPPNNSKGPRYRVNYNHLNNVIRHDGKFYVDLNWLTNTQFGPSGVAILDGDWKELNRFEYGWESHAFQFVNEDKYVICGSSDRIKPVNHPKQAGLMVEGELVFEHETDVFCKDMLVTEDRIYIVGGGVGGKATRGKRDGHLYILDRDFELLDEITFPNSGGFCGVAPNHE